METVNILGVPHAYALTAPTPSPQVLVFIHGWLLSRSYWQPLIELLSPDYQCLSYDLRGFGQSQVSVQSRSPETSVESSPWQYTPAAYAEDLRVLLEKLDITNAWLIGHSLGGSIALWAADQMPERVQGVVCVNAGGGIYLKEAFERFRSAGQRLLERRPPWLCQVPGLSYVFARANVARPVNRAWGQQRLLDFVRAEKAAALGALLDSTTEEEVNRLPQVVARLQQPVYFIAGAKDTVMAPKYVRHLASFHPLFQHCGENLLEIPDCGHLSMVECPEVVANQVRKILT